MIVIVDDRQGVAEAFIGMFAREGVAAVALCSQELGGWIGSVAGADLSAVEAFLVGQCVDRAHALRLIACRSQAVAIAVSEQRSLDSTLELFASGADDEVRKPVHARELLARIHAISRRSRPKARSASSVTRGDIQVYFDGRDPLVAGDVLLLPRRERRILEYLASNSGCRVSKAQIFSAVYGLFNEDVDESVVESHISKLRKRLRQRLGYDAIDCKRFLGYRLVGADEVVAEPLRSSPAQDRFAVIDRALQFAQD